MLKQNLEIIRDLEIHIQSKNSLDLIFISKADPKPKYAVGFLSHIQISPATNDMHEDLVSIGNNCVIIGEIDIYIGHFELG